MLRGGIVVAVVGGDGVAGVADLRDSPEGNGEGVEIGGGVFEMTVVCGEEFPFEGGGAGAGYDDFVGAGVAIGVAVGVGGGGGNFEMVFEDV